MRIHLFEFEDLSWFPDAIRQGGTDYLKYFLQATGYYRPVVPLLRETLSQTGRDRIVDLCSGGGGPLEQISRELNRSGGPVAITLSDKFPNTDAFRYVAERSEGRVGFCEEPVDAADVPEALNGLRTMFSAVHHFPPETVRAVLADAVKRREPIALFDGGDKNAFTVLGIILFHPLAFAVCTPFFRPFRFSRLLFTYVLPLIPLTTVWDGCVSILRLYQPAALQQIAEPFGEYTWRAGKVRNRLGMHVTYLIGQPASTKNAV